MFRVQNHQRQVWHRYGSFGSRWEVQWVYLVSASEKNTEEGCSHRISTMATINMRVQPSIKYTHASGWHVSGPSLGRGIHGRSVLCRLGFTSAWPENLRMAPAWLQRRHPLNSTSGAMRTTLWYIASRPQISSPYRRIIAFSYQTPRTISICTGMEILPPGTLIILWSKWAGIHQTWRFEHGKYRCNDEISIRFKLVLFIFSLTFVTNNKLRDCCCRNVAMSWIPPLNGLGAKRLYIAFVSAPIKPNKAITLQRESCEANTGE
ncbi:hypothetical protein C8R44DRAFT_776378 [Mycena epipterygia]|nr:hypothetical protein C8R44DRAFT_776378 [Mycena epipterygia]